MKTEELQRKYNFRVKEDTKLTRKPVNKNYNISAVWMDNYKGDEDVKVEQKKVDLRNQRGAGYNIISGDSSYGNSRPNSGAVKTPRMPRTASARPASGTAGSALANNLGADLRKIQYEKYIEDDVVRENLTEMLKRIQTLDSAK